MDFGSSSESVRSGVRARLGESAPLQGFCPFSMFRQREATHTGVACPASLRLQGFDPPDALFLPQPGRSCFRPTTLLGFLFFEGFPFHGPARSLDRACPPGVGSSGVAVPDDPWPAFRAFPSVEVRCIHRQSRFPPDPPLNVFPLQGSTSSARGSGFPDPVLPWTWRRRDGAPKHPCLSAPVLRSLANRRPDRLRKADRPSWGWCTSFRSPPRRAGPDVGAGMAFQIGRAHV